MSARAIVIGASGLIGRALVDTLTRQKVDVLGTRNKNAAADDLIPFDLVAEDLLDVIPSVGRDDVVYVLAAYSNPSWIFDNRAVAEKLNLSRTKDLLDAVKSRGARVVFMSSVETFDGEKGEYAEDDATRPLNIYGVMKEQIEQELYANHERYTVVRTGWNIGWDLTSRCVVKLTYETLLKPDARMARDNVFSIVDVNDTAAALAALMPHPEIRKIHICADDKVNRVWLARRIIEQSLNGADMGFREVDFREIAYTEPRGRVNDLVNRRSKELLGMKYRPAADVVDAKVALLDRHYASQAAAR